MSGTLRTLYHRYLALRLPWRRHILVGHDLAGNTFWEYHPSGLSSSTTAGRTARRILRPRQGRKTHLGEVTVSPAWHQWLKRTRAQPPSLEEQVADVERLKVLRVNARLADERWAGKARYIEKPETKTTEQQEETGQRRQALGSGGGGGDGDAEIAPSSAGNNISADGDQSTSKGSEDPWKKAAAADETGANPGAKWQPEAWEPKKK